MALTRSNYKCCMSNVSLDTQEATSFSFSGCQKVIHSRLWSSWSSKFGSELLPDGVTNLKESSGSSISGFPSSSGSESRACSATDSTVLTASQRQKLKDLQCQFILNELLIVRSEAMADHAVAKDTQTLLFKYIKVLFCWYLSIDAQSALIELNKFIETLQLFIASGTTEFAEASLNLLQMMMVSVFNCSSHAEVVQGIDEIQASTVAAETAIWRYIILASGIVSTTTF